MKQITVLGVGVVAAALLGSMAYGAIPDRNGVVHACYDKQSGQLRIFDTETGLPKGCGAKETAISWNRTGPQGPIGAAGAPGATGPAGPQGAVGPAGSQGPAGATGAIGPQGPKGDTGAAGSAGPRGEQGSAGPQGATGPQGPQGAQGIAGDDGSRYAYVEADGNVSELRSRGINDALVRRIDDEDSVLYCFYLVEDVKNVVVTQGSSLFGSFPLIGTVGVGLGCPTAGLLGDADFSVFWREADPGATGSHATNFYVLVH